MGCSKQYTAYFKFLEFALFAEAVVTTVENLINHVVIL